MVTKPFSSLIIKPISRADAKLLVVNNHYMKTFPSGSKIHLGIFDKDTNKVVGVCVLGYSSSTETKVLNIANNLSKDELIEMQRLWISDDYGHNSESYVLAQVMDLLKSKTNLKVVITHAGGCKNDCGIVYQASAWLYFGKDECNDFYLTKKGEYKNLIASLRFGRVSAKGKTKQQIGEELFGEGEIIESFRYRYLFPLHKGIRRRLSKISKPFPKDSKVFRKDQKWITNSGVAQGSN